MRLDELTPAQQQEIAEHYAEQKRAEKQAIETKRNGYKSLVDATVSEVFPELQQVAKVLHNAKRCVYEDFTALIELKNEIYGIKDGDRKSHTFTNKSQGLRVILGYTQIDYYDDTVTVGLQKVNQYIDSLAKDAESRMLVDALRKLMAKDAAGNLKPSRVLQLKQMATQSGNADFADGVNIIMTAYKPVESKQYVRAQYKGDNNEWKNVPLGMTEA